MRDLDRYTLDYAQLPFEAEQEKFRRQIVLEQIKKYQPRSVLEIGCGRLPLFPSLSDSIYCCVIEPAAQFFHAARELSVARKNVNVLHGTVEEYAISETRLFDMVICSCLLHEIENPKRFMNSLLRFCDDNSIVHINVPNANSLHRLLAVEMGLMLNVKEFTSTQNAMQQHATHDLESLCSSAISHGLFIIDSGSYFIKPFAHAQMAWLRDQGFLTDTMLTGLNRLTKHFPGNGSEIFINARRNKAGSATSRQ
jgi:2-polyprenyl-3-methyl-5-hydroxy-6-metoxy-1,4-benzoquinol methylase